MKELDCLEIFARKLYKNFDNYGTKLLNYFVPKINNVTVLDNLEIVMQRI